MGKSKDLATRVGIDDNANATAITIDSSENVGVGLTAPTAPLTIKSPTNAEAIHVVGRSDDIGQIKFLEADHTTILATIEARNSFVNFGSTANVPTKFMTNNNERMIINESGYVTMPHQPMAAAGSIMNSGGSNRHPASAINVQKGGTNLAATGRFTCPVAGVYRATLTGYTNYTNSYGYIILKKNGSSTGYDSHFNNNGNNATFHQIVGMSQLVNCSANDYLEFWGGNGNGYVHYSNILFELVG